MRISDITTRNIRVADPQQGIREVAATMARIDSGALLAGEGDRLVGIITDRDIAIRAVASGLPEDTPLGRIMSDDIHCCFEDENVQHMTRNMADIQMRRLPVLNREKRLVGMVSLGNIASCRDQASSATVLQGVVQVHYWAFLPPGPPLPFRPRPGPNRENAMKAMIFHDIGDIRLENVAESRLQEPTDVIVRPTAPAICGTDLHFVRGSVDGMHPGTILGYEDVGIVEALGDEVRNLQAGDRAVIPSAIACGNCVYCRAGYYAQCDVANPDGSQAGTAFFGGSRASGGSHGL